MPSRRPGAVTLAGLAIAGILVFLALDVALVFLRPQFSVLHNTESDYGSAGPYGWVMDLNFLLRGAVSLAVVGALMLVGGVRSRRLSVAQAGLIVWALAPPRSPSSPMTPSAARRTGSAGCTWRWRSSPSPP